MLKKIIITGLTTAICSACSSIEKISENENNSDETYAVISGGISSASNFSKYKNEITELASEGYKLTFNWQGSTNVAGAKTQILIRESDSIPQETLFTKGSYRKNPEELQKLGEDGYELVSTGYKFGTTWAFHRPKDAESRDTWEYKILDGHVHQVYDSLVEHAKDGWILAVKDYEKGNYCIIKKRKSSTDSYELKIIKGFKGKDKELDELMENEWQLNSRYYYSGRKGVVYKKSI